MEYSSSDAPSREYQEGDGKDEKLSDEKIPKYGLPVVLELD